MSYLWDYDASALERLLVPKAPSPDAARATARGLLRLSGRLGARGTWTADVLREHRIGAWAWDLALNLRPSASLSLHEQVSADDETVRMVFETADGRFIEAVVIPTETRLTLCISSQVGCARACRFCVTGAGGLERQLSAAEIVDQVRLANEWVRSHHKRTIQNIVFMGMGEPFDNLGAVIRAATIMTDPFGLGLAPGRITVSTVGITDKLERFFRECPGRLAVSLHAPDDTRRDHLVPANKRYPVRELMSTLRRLLPPKHLVFFEVALFEGYNDAPEDADAIAELVRDLPCRINLIPCNPGPDPALRAPSEAAVRAFGERLAGHGIRTLTRRPRGRDASAACGQLAGLRRRASQEAPDE